MTIAIPPMMSADSSKRISYGIVELIVRIADLIGPSHTLSDDDLFTDTEATEYLTEQIVARHFARDLAEGDLRTAKLLGRELERA